MARPSSMPCRTRLAPGLLLLGLALGWLGGPAARPARASIRSDCEKTWKTNYIMVESCIKQQSQALANLQSIPENAIKGDCKKTWGSNYIMVESCYEQQSEARGRLGPAPAGSAPAPAQPASTPPASAKANASNGCLTAREMIKISKGYPLTKRCPGGGTIQFNR